VAHRAAAGRLRTQAGGLLALLLLSGAGAGCKGSQHALFAQIVPKLGTVEPIHLPDAGSVIHDAAAMPMVKPIDAGARPRPRDEEDAGGPDPGLDPTVMFVWTETLPGQGTCRAGRYAGSFDCTVDETDFVGLPLSVSGQVAFSLEGSPEAQLLMITQGSIAGAVFSSGMMGSLDCLDQRLLARTVNGQALQIGGDAQNPFFLSFPTFDAALLGDFDDQALVIEGTFNMVNQAKQTCSGTFRVSAAP
jgi:hypothetical protein